MTQIVNTVSYPGQYNPSIIKRFMSDAFDNSVPHTGPFTRTARDIVIGSIQKDLGYDELAATQESEDDKKKKARNSVVNELPEEFKKYYTTLKPQISQDKNLNIAIYFQIPSYVVKDIDIDIRNMFTVLSNVDCHDLHEALTDTYQAKSDELVHAGIDTRHIYLLEMYWAPWAEIAKDVVN